MHGKDTRPIQFSLCSHKKLTNFGSWQTVCKPFVDSAVQVRNPIHTDAHLVCEPFASGLQTIWRACVYETLCYLLSIRALAWIQLTMIEPIHQDRID